ncbi:CLOCK-interacting pacemaker a [Brachionichthys hirsutus]|uniref:CLOCK-interacting pacemaker a n=1 Tax=Brachionichthys hirsutus TaxID=412623 RepID=UPI0036045804
MSRFSRPDQHRTPMFTRATHLGASRPDLERDSGFSDASSEHLSAVDATDSEDAGWNGSVVRAARDVAVMGGSYTGLPPVIVMNNFVLKQPSLMTPAEKQMGFPSSVEVLPPSQVVLLQPMVSNSSSSSQKTSSETIRQPKSCVPVRKSYPRIAPLPSDKPAKRMASSRLRVGSKSVHDQQKRRHSISRKRRSSSSPQPARPTAVKPIPTFEAAVNQSQVTERQFGDSSSSLLARTGPLPPYTNDLMTEMDSDGVHAAKYQDSSSIGSEKLVRFSNTYNMLSTCGLLGITMRTKRLIKENQDTQGQLQQLQEQTALLLEALSSGDPQLWSKLQVSLQHTNTEQGGGEGQRMQE